MLILRLRLKHQLLLFSRVLHNRGQADTDELRLVVDVAGADIVSVYLVRVVTKIIVVVETIVVITICINYTVRFVLIVGGLLL